MIMSGAEIKVLVATKPVDFRKQADTLAALVQEALSENPYSGAIYVFRSKRADRVTCCGGALHVIGEDVSKRLDRVPAKLRVLVTRRPKFACRSCEKNGADNIAGVIQAPPPARLIVGGLPTEALVADVVVSKYADHLPLYRKC
jgi:transposase